MSNANVLPLPNLAPAQFGRGKSAGKPQFGHAGHTAAAVSGQAESAAVSQPQATAVDALSLRDALVARQPRFGGDNIMVTPTVMPLAPYTRREKDGSETTLPSPSAVVMPSIIEENDEGFAYSIDPISLALASNTVYFYEDFNQNSALRLTASLDYLKNKIVQERQEERGMSSEEARSLTPEDPKFDPDKDIVTIEINSPGGAITSLYNIMGAVNALKNNGIIVQTVTQGLAASCGSLLATIGSPGYRKMTEHSYVMIHQPLTQVPYTQATNVGINNKRLQKMKKDLTWELYALSTKSDISDIPEDQRKAYKKFTQEPDIDDVINHKVDVSYAAFARENGIDYEPTGKKTYVDFVDGMERDNWLDADASINEWGLVDEVVNT